MQDGTDWTPFDAAWSVKAIMDSFHPLSTRFQDVGNGRVEMGGSQ